MIQQPAILWQPTEADISGSRLRAYRDWLRESRGIETDDYESLWQWSVDQPAIFWQSIVDFFEVKFHSDYTSVLSGGPMPDAVWFSGGSLNYAEHIFLGMQKNPLAIQFSNEKDHNKTVTTEEMWSEVNRIKTYFLKHGVQSGDRIVGYLPNIPEATYAFLAAVSLGAVWSCCSQDFGVSSVIDRFAQIEPVIFVAADGYYYNGKTHQREEEIQAIREALPTLRSTLMVRYLFREVKEVKEAKGAEDAFAKRLRHPKDAFAKRLRHPKGNEGGLEYFDELDGGEAEQVKFEAVPFDHPLWILYSSGTTGAPKAITHSHGGCLLEHLKYLAFHNDVHAGENFFWYTTTGWMMWNFLQGSMLLGATVILYDGSPGYPDLDRLWKLSEQMPIHHFGTSAPYLVACMKAGIQPGKSYDLSAMRSIGSTGSPLPPEAFSWVYKSVHDRIWLCSMSGGTDVCTAFVGGVIEKPVREGEIQARGLGCALYAFDEDRQPVQDVLGEMVITEPMPSMPVYFWNDPGKEKYRASYFEDIPGVWRHGDWVKITTDGGIVIYGRSDATLNRQGVRIGTAEIYRVLNDIPEIEDGLIVNLELEGGRHYMPLFVKLRNDDILDEALVKAIAHALRSKCSPRHVPDDVYQVADIPYTISGKKMEAPVKKILMGMKVDKSLNLDAMRNPESLVFFQQFKVPGI